MKRTVVCSTLLVALLAVADWLNPVRAGLNGTYYANANWENRPVVSTIDERPGNQQLLDAFRGEPPAEFSATWAGSVLAMHDGPYVFGTVSDDGSAVYVDGQTVVDNGGRRDWPRGATGVVNLTRGVHSINVRYAQQGGLFHVELLWGRTEQSLEQVPGWALTPRRVGFPVFVASAGLKRMLAAAQWLWIGSLVAWLLVATWTWLLQGRAWLEREQLWRGLRWILAGSLILNGVGFWWGLPGGSWVPDELTPTVVLGAAQRWFAGGWFDRYPPFHFYLLTTAYSPLILLERLGRVTLTAEAPYTLMAALGRLLSVGAAAGTVVAIGVAGAESFGKRTGIFAAAMFTLVAPFVYYAKTANLDVPYLFWFAVSLVFYLRALHRGAMRDFIAFAGFGALAICTKDQAYGLYLLMPFALVEQMWREKRESRQERPFIGALLDRRLIFSALAALMLFVCIHNLAFNWRGFLDHVRLITGPASESYRDFEKTAAGRIGLLRLTVGIVGMAWGWPMLLISVAGIVLAALEPTSRRMLVWLSLPVASYYVGFIDVVLYNYDRFMLPICLVLSLFGGLALDRWLRTPARAWRVLAVSAVFAYGLVNVATVDVAMIRDSRYAVERWLASRLSADDVVGYVFPEQYYPRFERFNNHSEMASLKALGEWQPSYFVLNVDYGRAEPRESEIGRLIAGLHDGTLGYSVVFRYRDPLPWPRLPGAPRDLVGDRTERPIVSVLRHINPLYEVFKKGS